MIAEIIARARERERAYQVRIRLEAIAREIHHGAEGISIGHHHRDPAEHLASAYDLPDRIFATRLG